MRVLAKVAAVGALALAGAAAAQESGAAVTTSGSGVLTICRDWLVYNSCTTYNVAVPKRVGVGDSILLTYGSNPKDYNFRVLRIRRDGECCTIYSDHSANGDDGERLEVARCRAAEKPAAAR